ncbi:MAG: restriction endonuclease [Myxococcales bacterium]|nr:MAG: restriction endonuclease [Myxococcales bacterium]
MTFTEAAIVVLRQVGRPLHYKKITELAIDKHLLSHVGKSPEVTMSARLAMIAKKLEGDQSIVKVKPGVFGLKEFSEEVLAAADSDGDDDIRAEDIEIPEEVLNSVSVSQGEEDEDENHEEASSGAGLFPEEDDDDEPILAGLDESKGSSDRSSKRRKRRRNRGPEGANESRSDEQRRPQQPHQARSQRSEPSFKLAGNWDREPEDDELTAKGLADAVLAVLDAEERGMRDLEWVADRLVRKGRLQGQARALVPTVAAALRADNAGRRAEGKRARFRLAGERLWLTDWLISAEAVRVEENIRRLAREQRQEIHKLFLKQVAALPVAGFAELVASWLNAEGVHAVRAVRRPGSSARELHFAGVQRIGRNETHLAIVVRRDGSDIDKGLVEQTRGGLHHYGNASAAWFVTLGRVSQDARAESNIAGTAPCLMFDGYDWTDALEAVSIGLEKSSVILSLPQFDLLAALAGSDTLDIQDGGPKDREQGGGDNRNRMGRSRRRRRGRDRNRDGNASTSSENETDASQDNDESSDSSESAKQSASADDNGSAKDIESKSEKATESENNSEAEAQTVA